MSDIADLLSQIRQNRPVLFVSKKVWLNSRSAVVSCLTPEYELFGTPVSHGKDMVVFARRKDIK